MGTLTLSYNAATATFTATVTAAPGFNVVGVSLTSPAGSFYTMTHMTGGVNPSTWQYSLGMPGQQPPPNPAPGTWSASATLQGTGNVVGTTSV